MRRGRWLLVGVALVAGVAGAVAPSSTTPLVGYLMPLQCGANATITQGYGASFSHRGKGRFAVDLDVPRGTPLVAMEDGKVLDVGWKTHPGDRCFDGGNKTCANDANYVVVEHADGTGSLYLHLEEPSVTAGDVVKRGDPVGLSGSSGWSTGPHAHVQRQTLCGSWWCQSVPTAFADVGVPAQGVEVQSGNCTSR